MRVFSLIVGGLCALTAVAPAQEGKIPESQSEKISYAIGSRIGMGLKRDGVELDVNQLLAGVVDAYSEKELKLTDEQMMEVMEAFQKTMQAKSQQESSAKGEMNLGEGKAFLESNGKKDGVTTTTSGLQYEVLTTGKGPKPTKEDKIKAHYHGTLIDGTVFDSSVDRGEPVSFPVSGVISGWTEALQLMPVGSKWRLYIPSNLAYGDRGAGPMIGPNATLIFDVELLEIE